VPQLFVATGATNGRPRISHGWDGSRAQAKPNIYAKYILGEQADARIAVLYQNDDYGKNYLKGLKDGLGAKAASMIVAEEELRDHRAHHRQSYCKAQIERRRRVRQHFDSEVRGPAIKKTPRSNEAASPAKQRVEFDRRRNQASRV